VYIGLIAKRLDPSMGLTVMLMNTLSLSRLISYQVALHSLQQRELKPSSSLSLMSDDHESTHR